MKKRFKLIFVLLFVTVILCLLFIQTKQHKDDEVTTNLQLKLGTNLQLESSGYTFEKAHEDIIDKNNAKDFVYTYNVKKDNKLGTLELTIRKIDNGDQFVFSKFTNQATEGTTIPLKITFSNHTDYDLYSFEEEIEQEHDRVFGIDYTTNVKGVYTLSGKQPYSLYLSQNYISKELTQQYDEQHSSILRELVNEDKFIEVTQDSSTITFNMKLRTTDSDQISENWFLVSKQSLFNNEDEMAYYKNLTNYEFIKSPKWQTATGNYTKLPWSVEPATKVGYGRNLVALQGKNFVARYKINEDRFYYDMLVNSVNYLFDFKSDEYLWQTEYTSTWLKREYGIIAPYTDTRHNENIALFLSNAGTILKNEEIKKSDLMYADFLSTQQQIDNILTTTNGYYILDYYSTKQTKKTHVSLNHALGETNFLLETYKKTNDEKYLNTAMQIKQAVEDTGLAWINKNNNDLWYQINGDFSFEGKDYDFLTLQDLLKSLNNFDDLNIEYNDVFLALIESKVKYIIENEVEIPIALQQELIKRGYEKLIGNYQHTYSY